MVSNKGRKVFAWSHGSFNQPLASNGDDAAVGTDERGAQIECRESKEIASRRFMALSTRKIRKKHKSQPAFFTALFIALFTLEFN